MPWRDGLRALRSARTRGGVAATGPPRGRVTRADVEAVLADPAQIRMDFQPILDVRSARTAGWEALARFEGPRGPGPDRWFAAAHRVGLGPALEEATVRRALSALRVRTPGTFLSVNVSPAALDHPGVVDLIAGSAPLTGLVLELTEHVTPPEPGPGPWTAACRRLRDLGATIAIDDLGTGYAEMLQILQLHPQIIKIDKSLVAAVDDDPAHRAMLRFLGRFADELDAWLLAEGVETTAQLRALQNLGVPLAQGWLVGVPAPAPAPCRDEVTAAARHPPRAAAAADVVTVGEVMRPATGAVWAPSALRVPVDLPLAEAARRALTRPPERRYDAVQCIGPGGDVAGVLALHDLMLEIVERGTPAATAVRRGG